MPKHKKKKMGPQQAWLATSSKTIQDTQILSRPAGFRVKITTANALILLAILGTVVFFTGLGNPFLGDDQGQIVNNEYVHSFNVKALFSGSTFSGGPGQPLTGIYYRPLMSTVFSLLYVIFGPNPLAFHLVQLAMHIVSAFLIFLIFRYLFRPGLSLLLAVVFLIHPSNSQSVFSISAMQEPLFLLFGLAGFWTLLKFQDKSPRYLWLTAGLLALSLFAKESGILFVAMSLSYLFFFNRKRFPAFSVMMASTFLIYMIFKIHAVGLGANPHNAPIDEINLWSRAINIPAIVAFYIGKLLWPAGLAHGYYWAYSTITVGHFLLPLLLDLGAVLLMAYLAKILLSRSPRHGVMFVFFAGWFVIGLILHLQIVPLDFTASETWLYFPIIGALGMLGSYVDSINLEKRWIPYVHVGIVVIVLLFGLRSAVRGRDWADIDTLSSHDLAVSKEDYNSEMQVANQLAHQGQLKEAQKHAEHSIKIHPNAFNFFYLGVILTGEGQYAAAHNAYLQGLKYREYYALYDNLGALTLVYGDPTANENFLLRALKKFPEDSKLWYYLAIDSYKNGKIELAKAAIQKSSQLGYSDPRVYNSIMTNQPLNISIDIKPY